MAGPSIIVRVLGDLTGLGKSMDASAAKAESASKSISKSFGTMFSTLNTTGALGPFADVFSNLQQGFAQIEENGHRATNAMLGIGVAATGAGALLTEMGSKDQAAQQQLANAIDNTGRSWADYERQVSAAEKSQTRFGNTAAQTDNALQQLTQATGDPTKALNMLSLATDLAASKHEALSEASTQLARILNGNTRVLKEFGIIMPHVGKAAGDFATQADEVNAAITDLSAKIHGNAIAAADTFTGHIHAMTAGMENAVAVFGQKFGPAITAAGAALTVLRTGVTTYTAIAESFRKAQEAATTATEALSAAEDTAAVSEGLALAPILLIGAAVAALAVIGYEVATHWKAIWAGIKDAVKAVWDWVKANWPLLLGILLGPIGLAAAEIYKHWRQIWDGLKDVWAWISGIWPTVEHALVKPITDAANAIVAAFKAAFNAVADLWNGTVGSLHFSIPSWVPFIGGDKFAVPDIPHLAQGGVITQTGFVYAHAGEAITPANQGFGPAVYIEHAQFNDPVDVDLLMKKVEFALSAGLPV